MDARVPIPGRCCPATHRSFSAWIAPKIFQRCRNLCERIELPLRRRDGTNKNKGNGAGEFNAAKLKT